MAKCSIDKTYYSALGELYSVLGTKDLTGAELVKVSRISDEMINVLRTSDVKDETVSDFSTARREAITYLYMFEDSSIINDAIDMLNKIDYVQDDTAPYSLYVVLSHALKARTGAYKVPAKMVVPEKFKKTSSVYILHELIHMLKERNPLECRDFIKYGEVLPMLMELIIAYSYENDKMEAVFNERSKMIKHSAKSFKELYEEYKCMAFNEQKEYLPALDESGTYINSFYYTLALFSLYLRDRDYVLGLVASVLTGRYTTSEIINYAIHGSYDMYQDGLAEFNSSL